MAWGSLKGRQGSGSMLMLCLKLLHWKQEKKGQRGQAEPISVATPAEPRGEQKTFFVQILGGEKLFQVCWQVPVKYF